MVSTSYFHEGPHQHLSKYRQRTKQVEEKPISPAPRCGIAIHVGTSRIGGSGTSGIGDRPAWGSQNGNHKPLIFLFLKVSRSPVRADRSVSSSEYDCCSREVKLIKENSKYSILVKQCQKCPQPIYSLQKMGIPNP